MCQLQSTIRCPDIRVMRPTPQMCQLQSTIRCPDIRVCAPRHWCANCKVLYVVLTWGYALHATDVPTAKYYTLSWHKGMHPTPLMCQLQSTIRCPDIRVCAPRHWCANCKVLYVVLTWGYALHATDVPTAKYYTLSWHKGMRPMCQQGPLLSSYFMNFNVFFRMEARVTWSMTSSFMINKHVTICIGLVFRWYSWLGKQPTLLNIRPCKWWRWWQLCIDRRLVVQSLLIWHTWCKK